MLRMLIKIKTAVNKLSSSLINFFLLRLIPDYARWQSRVYRCSQPCPPISHRYRSPSKCKVQSERSAHMRFPCHSWPFRVTWAAAFSSTARRCSRRSSTCTSACSIRISSSGTVTGKSHDPFARFKELKSFSVQAAWIRHPICRNLAVLRINLNIENCFREQSRSLPSVKSEVKSLGSFYAKHTQCLIFKPLRSRASPRPSHCVVENVA